MAVVDDRVDLALLSVLDVLLEERSVTRAGRRLGLTQSTVSHSLARLRETFRDPLLVRVGRGLVPTPRAEALQPVLRRLLVDARRLVTDDLAFDPARSTRAFQLLCPDLLVSFLPELLGRFGREAPLARLEARPPTRAGGGELDVATTLAGATDLALLPAHEAGPGLVQRVLGRVRWCIVARRGHPGVKRGRLDRATWLRYPHVQVGTGGGGAGFVGQALAAKGLERRVGFVAPGFLAAPFAVAHTDHFFAAPRELVANIAAQLDLQLLEPPIPLAPVKVAMLWHERVHAEPGNRWLRDAVAEAAKTLLG